MVNHPSLNIIVGAQGAGKSTLACLMARNKRTVMVTPKTILSVAVTGSKVRQAEVMIIDECAGEGACRMLQQIWGSGRIGFIRPGREATFIPTPDLIAVFQSDQISQEWLERFKSNGATVTVVSPKSQIVNHHV